MRGCIGRDRQHSAQLATVSHSRSALERSMPCLLIVYAENSLSLRSLRKFRIPELRDLSTRIRPPRVVHAVTSACQSDSFGGRAALFRQSVMTLGAAVSVAAAL